MAQASNIEWTESTWNPVVGCTRVSEGCRNCYAERMAKRLAAMAEADRRVGRKVGRKANYEAVVDEHGRWNNQVYLDHDAVDDPLSWRLPRVIFVNSMSDLFHKAVPNHFIKRVFDVMNRCPQHTFQVLTKRPERTAELADQLIWSPNIWMGTSVEDSSVVHRVHALKKVPAKVRFLSVEPLLGPVPQLPVKGIQWVIVGGESGPGARLMRREWVLQIRDRCEKYDVPFFFKQWGGVNKKLAGRELEGQYYDGMPRQHSGDHVNDERISAA